MLKNEEMEEDSDDDESEDDESDDEDDDEEESIKDDSDEQSDFNFLYAVIPRVCDLQSKKTISSQINIKK